MKDSQVKRFILLMWEFLYNGWNILYKTCLFFVDSVYKEFNSSPFVKNLEESLQHIVSNRCSVARYGDGEMKLIMGRDISFQKCHPRLRQSLANILSSKDSNLVVCIPNIFTSLDIYTEHNRKFWTEYLSRSRRQWYKLLDKDRIYYDAFVSRCYLPYRDKSKAANYFQMWQQFWSHRDVLIVEGSKTRFGVGNDLFDNVRSVQRVLAPVTNAFDRYDEILNEIKKYGKDCLVLIALGPTATVLAADLSLAGYQAIDIGHLDIEYEWFLKKVDHKIPVQGKYVNEAGAGKGVGDCFDEKYQMQIVKKIE